MTGTSSHGVTELLVAWGQGEQAALEQLAPLVHAELHRIAHRYMGRERAGHTLQTTALVNEAYLRLIDVKQVNWQNRAHFFGLSAQLMRHILVDFARSRGYQKRGGGLQRVTLDEALIGGPEKGSDLVALDDALNALAVNDARKARVVELRFFGGLTIEEAAAVLEISTATTEREWATARMWLRRRLSTERRG